MAILVRYEGDERSTAIYLSQRFYRLIFRKARKEGQGYPVLREIALLKYKSPILTVGGGRLEALVMDPDRLMGRMLWGKKEIADFRAICAQSFVDGRALRISGDMYPELPPGWTCGSDDPSHPRRFQGRGTVFEVPIDVDPHDRLRG